MRQMRYPAEGQFEQNFIKVFQVELGRMQAKWIDLRGRYPELSAYPADVKDFLIANFHQLTVWYNNFMSIPLSRREDINRKLEHRLFDYDYWCSAIAEYFKDPANGFNLISCVYCDMAYVNAYEVNPDAEAIYILNNAPDDELMKKLRTKSLNSLNVVKRARPYKTRADFDRTGVLLRWAPDKYDKIFKPNYKYKHHFDLDHVLPKSRCRLVSLSLYNLVPSCQVCNQRLKKTKVLGIMGVANEKLSPTSPDFDFDSQVSFHVIPKKGVKAGGLRPSIRPYDYELQLTPLDPDYDVLVKIFKLQERYAHHKIKALHWLEMKCKYTDARIVMMANALHHPSFSSRRIKSDIFQNELYKDGNMCFSKLREDMLK